MADDHHDDDDKTEQLQDRLDQLGDQIKDVKDDIPESQGGSTRRHFIDSGTEDADQPVDDTIAPPG